MMSTSVHGARILAVLLAGAMAIALPGRLRAAPVGSRTDVQSVGAADDGSAASVPRHLDAIRRLLAPHLSPAELQRVLQNPRALAPLSRLMNVLESTRGRNLALQVEVSAPGPDGRTAWISLRQKGSLERSSADRTWRQETSVTVGEVALLLRPPAPGAPAARPAPEPVVADAVPSGKVPCAADDPGCWLRRSLRELALNPRTCEPYLLEQDAHLKRLDLDADANGEPAARPTPDLAAPAQARRERLRDWADAYPSGEIVQGYDGFARRDIRITNGPSRPAPVPVRASDACRAEFAERSVTAVPTLACTREVVDDLHWRGSDGLVKAAEAPFSPVGSLPFVQQILATKARKVGEDVSWQGVFALRWMERLVAAMERKDSGYIDRALASLSDSPEARRVLAERLRHWLSNPAQAPWHGAIRDLYGERFTSLYPQAADADGMPMLSRFPTRLWWATNWLATVARRGITPETAADLLRCSPEAERSSDVLKDLAPMLAQDPRFGPIVDRVLRRL